MPHVAGKMWRPFLEWAMAVRKLGIPPKDLRDADLKRELRHMWRTREKAILEGSVQALATHTRRMLELEQEYIARFPGDSGPNPARTRRGSRARAGQPATGRRR